MADSNKSFYELVFKITGFMRSSRSVEERLKQIQKSFTEITKRTEVFNREGRRLQTVFEGVDKEGKKVVARVSEFGTILHGTVKQVKDYATANVEAGKKVNKSVKVLENLTKKLTLAEQKRTAVTKKESQKRIQEIEKEAKTVFIAEEKKEQLIRKSLATEAKVTEKRLGNWNKLKRKNLELLATTVRLHKAEKAKLQTVKQSAALTAKSIIPSLKKTQTESKKTTKSIQQMTLSWRSLVRVIVVQFAHRAVTAFTEAVKSAITNAVELTKRVAEIRTLAMESNVATGEWTEGLRRLSEQFGMPVLDQAEAAYQALSNQVVHGAEAFRFLASANKFAVITNSQTTESVNLLSSAINAFRIDVSRTEDIAASFFKTIELGRVRSTDMADSFGDVAVLANQLDITLNELQGTIATLTIQGIKYNKAQTQIRGIFIKLIKPTNKMKELFRKIGVESGEAAIRTFGWVGFLRKLQKATKGSSTELAKYISRIRGISGAMALQGKNLDLLQLNIDQIANAYKTYQQVADITIKSVGKRFEIEVAKITQHFDRMGKSLLETILNVSDNLGGLAQIVKKLADVFIRTIYFSIIPALAALLLAMKSMVVAHPLSGLFIILGGLAAAFELLRDKSIETAEATYQAWKESQEKIRIEIDKTANRIADFLDKTLKNVRRVIGSDIANELADLASMLDIMATNFKNIHEKFTNSLEILAKSSRARLSQMKSDLKSVESEIKRVVIATLKTTAKLEQILGVFSLEGINIDAQITTIENAIARLNERSAQAIKDGNSKAFKIAEDSIESLLNKLRDLQIQKRKQELATRERSIKEEQRYQNARLRQIANYEKEIAKAERKAIEQTAKSTERELNKAFKNFIKSQDKIEKAKIKFRSSLLKKSPHARRIGLDAAQRLFAEGKKLEKISTDQFNKLKKRLKQEQLERDKAAKAQINLEASIAAQKIAQDEKLRENIRNSKLKAFDDEIKLAQERGEKLQKAAEVAQQKGQTDLAKNLAIASEATFEKEKALRQSKTEFTRQETIREAEIQKQASIEEITIFEKAERAKVDIEINSIKERMKLREQMKLEAEARGKRVTGFDKAQKRDLEKVKKLEEKKSKIFEKYEVERVAKTKKLNKDIKQNQVKALKASIDAEEELIKRIIKRVEGQKKILDFLKEQKKVYNELILLQQQQLAEFNIIFKKTKEFDIGKVVTEDPKDAIIALEEQVRNLERLKELNKKLKTTEEGRIEQAKRKLQIENELVRLKDIIFTKEKEAEARVKGKEVTTDVKTAINIITELGKKNKEALDVLREIEDLFEEIGTKIVFGIGMVADTTIGEFKEIEHAIEGIAATFLKTFKTGDPLFKPISDTAKELKEALISGDEKKVFRPLVKFIALLTTGIKEQGVFYKGQEEFLKTLNKLSVKLAEGVDIKKLKEIVTSTNESIANALKVLKKYNIATVDTVEGTRSLADQTQRLADQLKRVLDNLIAIGKERGINSINGAVEKVTGGLIGHFADGGKARGTDTIPAMLSPGEFVVNAKATKDFYSQLVAINSGHARRFNNGGTVTNQIGDIIINPQAVGDVKIDVVTLGRELQKAIRQKRIPGLN